MDRIEKLKQLMEANPADSFVQHALALEYIKLGDDEEAKKVFEQLLKENENYVGSYYHLGKLLERMNAREDAVQWYEKGMLKAKENGDHHAYNELRGAYEELEEN
jgi:tetratricopeptide (TPR) repeat protein